jgi:uncharacterized protein (TIGR00369 family)
MKVATNGRTDAPEARGESRTKRVSWHDPSILATAAAAMAGRDFLQAVVEGRLPPPPIANLIGSELVSVGDGEVLFRCTPDDSTYNPIGMVHGGLLCTLLDSAAGCAVHTRLEAGVGYASIEIKVSFLRPVRTDSGTLDVVGRALRVGRQIAFAEARAHDGNGELVGHATSSIAVLRR